VGATRESIPYGNSNSIPFSWGLVPENRLGSSPLDAFGVLVLCFVTGNAGGITRDIMIGALPPAAINEWRYVAVSILAGLIVFFFGYPLIARLSSPVLLFDAAGLGLFCVAGADKALAFHTGPVAATLLGTTTGIGGGMVRDVLVMEIPTVLRTELYAVAALLGAAFTVAGQRLGMPLHVAAPLGAALCIALRLLALRYGWHLPVARVKATSASEGEDQVGRAGTQRRGGRA